MTAAPVPVDRLSATALAHADRCLHSFLLYQQHRDTAPPSHPKARGTALHLVGERMLRNMIENGEATFYAPGHTQDPKTGEALPEDEAAAKRNIASLTEAVVNEIRAEHPELHCTHDDWDKVRLMAFHLAVAFPVDPSRVVAIERKFVLDLGPCVLVGKIDVATMEGQHADVVDYKTSLALPSQEQFETHLPMKLYGLLLAFGQPTRKITCPGCDGRTDTPAGRDCPTCLSDGFVEHRDEPIGAHVQWVNCREVYPRYLLDDGSVWERERKMTRTELTDFRVDLEALIARILQARDTDDWPATPGSHCLTYCPAANECPLPEAFRGPVGSDQGLRINVPVITEENVLEQAERWYFMSETATALKKALRGHAVETGAPIPIGTDLELAFRADSRRQVDWEAWKAACDQADRAGLPRPMPKDYESESKSTPFVKRKRAA
jgi:hypothetical protein